MSFYTPYRWCIVPNCKNATSKTPEKLFIRVPNDINMRNEWIQLSGRDPTKLSTKSVLYVCEDHFDLEKDMENYMKYKIMGSVKRIKMKPNTKPFKFRFVSAEAGPHEPKLECLSQAPDSTSYFTEENVSFTKQTADKEVQVQVKVQNKEIQIMPAINFKSVQAILLPRYRSKAVQVNLKVKQSITYPIKLNTSVATSTSPQHITVTDIPTTSYITRPVKRKLSVLFEERSDSEISLIPSIAGSTSQDFSPTKISTSDSSLPEDAQRDQKFNLINTMTKIKKKPRLYIGISKEHYFLIDIIKQHTNISEPNILLCLSKIRLNSTFSQLSDDFGLSQSRASKIFSTNIIPISKVMSPFIKQFKRESIKLNLPIAFRHKYYKVTNIIDCLEIEIQKPSNAVHQALTWSEYKKANTIKYLVSCTPDGLISYISAGYGGRVTDITLFEHSKFLDTLPPNACLLADRGFKHIEMYLSQRNITLMRPPSVATGSKLSKSEVRRTKEIASLRIHVERVIRRIREFAILKPHSVVNINLVSVLDECIITACALINLQDTLIK